MLKLKTPFRRVDFYGDAQDKTVIACMLLGWRTQDIADFTGLSPSQVYYRINRRLGQKLSDFRGRHKVCRKFLEILRDGDTMEDAERGILRSAQIAPKLDPGVLK